MFNRFAHSFSIANEAIMQNKIRSVLTSLGIICGVASVIAMLAIGKGAEQEILEKMKLLGTNNIIITPLDKKEMEKKIVEEAEADGESGSVRDETKKKKRFSPGLTMQDAESIRSIVPHISAVSTEIVLESSALRKEFNLPVKLVGVNESYFNTNQYSLAEGSYFHPEQMRNSISVCIIGNKIRLRLFAGDDPIGKQIKCGNQWLTVIGVLKDKSISKDNIKNLGLRDYNFDVYIPINTMLLRYVNRNLVTRRSLNNEEENSGEENLNQLDRIVVTVKDSKVIKNIAEIIGRMLERRHNREIDYELIVPELLLEQEQRTKSIFNIVLGAIASISLIVGGIGIMNIMLASVMERIKEIGIRMAVGARQRDIMMQFLAEAIAISVTGGLIGIVLGFVLSFIIEKSTGIETIITVFSVLLSFLVSISVGLVFGLMPARKAALQDPIVSLRYE